MSEDRRLDLGSEEPQRIVLPRPRRLVGDERQAKLDKCGSWYSFFSPQSGTKKAAQFVCKLKECEKCGEKRGEALKERMEYAMQSGGLSMFNGTKSEVMTLIRSLGKDLYLRLPQDGDMEILFINSNLGIGEDIPFAYFETIEWGRIQNIPDGRLSSGNLGKPKVDEIETDFDDSYKVTVSTYEIDPKFAQVSKECEMKAIAQTLEFNPTTPDEIQDAINRRQFYYEFYLRREKVAFHTGSKFVFGKLCLTDWLEGTSQSFHIMIERGWLTEGQIQERLSSNFNEFIPI